VSLAVAMGVLVHHLGTRSAAMGSLDRAIGSRDVTMGSIDHATGTLDTAVGTRDASIGSRDAAFVSGVQSIGIDVRRGGIDARPAGRDAARDGVGAVCRGVGTANEGVGARASGVGAVGVRIETLGRSVDAEAGNGTSKLIRRDSRPMTGRGQTQFGGGGFEGSRDMAGKFIPNSDQQFAHKAEGFARVIARDPGRFMLSDEDAAELTQAVGRFCDAMAVLRGPDRRTTIATLKKSEARVVAEQAVRKVANVIRANPKLSAPEKLAVDIKLRPPRQRRRECPQTPPALHFIRSIAEHDPKNAAHVLHFCDPSAGGAMGKPAGAARIELWADLIEPGDETPTEPGRTSSRWPLHLRSYTRNPIKVCYPMPAVPMRVVYWARRADATGEVGPFSQTCAAPVVCGHASQAAVVDARRVERRPTMCVVTIRDVSQPRLEHAETDALLLFDESVKVEPLEPPAQRQLPEAA
jgi:hypothetical protein